MVVIVMGVAGSGKTTVASELARVLDWEFLDADSFHSPANIAKMRAGIPLSDSDRVPWLGDLRGQIERSMAGARSLVLACSALKESYRQQLIVGPSVRLVYLRGPFDLLRQRLGERKSHFMPEQLLASQLEALEEPTAAITVNIQHSVEEIVAKIREQLGLSSV